MPNQPMRKTMMLTPELTDYQRIARMYELALREPVEPRGSRLEFPFTQAVRLLSCRSPFNDSLPRPFLDVALRTHNRDAATVEHFSYDENRQFFLSDLFDYIHLRGAQIQGTGVI